MTKYLLLGTCSDDEWVDGDINTCAVPVDDLPHLARLGDYAADTFDGNEYASRIEFRFYAYWISELIDDLVPDDVDFEPDLELAVVDVDIDAMSHQRVEAEAVAFYRDGDCEVTAYIKHTNIKVRSILFDPSAELKGLEHD